MLFLFINYVLGWFVGVDYHIGLGCIQGHLRRRGIPCGQLICREPVSIPELARRVMETGARVIGFTCYDSNYYANKLLARRLKQLDSGLVIVFGGPTATFSAEHVLGECPEVDICVRGEGEVTAAELAEALRCGGSLDRVAGISFRGDHGIHHNPDRPLLCGDAGDDELDIVPSPYLEGLIPAAEAPAVGVITSRGCVYRCTYCNFSAMFRHTIRNHSVERVIAELRLIDRALVRPQRIRIFDDLFPLDRGRARRLLGAIADERFRNVRLGCQSRADLVDGELLRQMRRAGFTSIRFGLESAVPKVLRTIRKVAPGTGDNDGAYCPEHRFLARVGEGVEHARQAGFEDILINIIVGLPGESEGDARETLDYVRRLNVTQYSHNVLEIYAGTELESTAPRYGLARVPSAHGRPETTLHAYDVAALPTLPNAWQIAVAGQHLHGWLSAFAGAVPAGRWRPNNAPAYVAFRNAQAATDKNFCWLADNISLSTVVGIEPALPDGATALAAAVAALDAAAQAGAPVNEIDTCVRPGRQAAQDFEYWGIFARHVQGARRRFSVRPLAAAFDEARCGESTRGEPVLFTVRRSTDLETLAQWAGWIRDGRSESLPAALRSAGSYVLPECRWSAGACPAAELRLLRLSGDGQVGCCPAGAAAGQPGDSLEKLRASVRQQQERAARERGCEQCQIRDNCSRCLFPQPFTANEYCRFRRAHPIVPAVTDLLRALRRIHHVAQFGTSPGTSAAREVCCDER